VTASTQHKLPSHWWWELSTRDFATLDLGGVVAILPVGAVEQHGPHLPVCVDAAINQAVIARAVAMMTETSPILVLPPTTVGKSTEHTAFPGTLTLSHDTLTNVWLEIGASVHRAGIQRMLFLNSHGGQPQIVEVVCRELRIRHGMLAVGTMWSRITRQDDLFDADERKHGIHGGEIETSVMLAAFPGLVKMQHASNFIPLSVELERAGGLLTPEGAVGFGWQAQDLCAEGACGNAAAADARRGEILIDRAARSLLKLCDEIAAFPMEKLRTPPAHRSAVP
jgi:creatinine amidohydrolase